MTVVYLPQGVADAANVELHVPWIGLIDGALLAVMTDPPGDFLVHDSRPRPFSDVDVAVRHHHIGAIQKLLANGLGSTGPSAVVDSDEVFNELYMVRFGTSTMRVAGTNTAADTLIYRSFEFALCRQIRLLPVVAARPLSSVGQPWPELVAHEI